MTPKFFLAATILIGTVGSGCVSTQPGPRAVIVTDLADVRGCRFMGTVRPPRVEAGLRRVAAYEAYQDELRRRTAAMGATHLYFLNPAAGWGAAQALGTAYLCLT